jgi:hypothetical protein
MDLFTQFQTDEQAEVEGVWVPLSTTARLKIARIGNARHPACLKRISTPHVRPGMRMSDIDDEMFDKLTREAMAESILVGWENILWKGEVLPYSKENALRVLQVKDFFTLVLTAANSIEHFRVARIAELEKN